MRSKNHNFFLLACVLALLGTAACPTAPVTNGPGNNSVAVNTPKAADNASTPQPVSNDSAAPTGSLATPSDAYRTAFALRQKKDGQGLKRVLSKEIIEFFTEMGKVSNKSLDEMLDELTQKPQSAAPEVRNEKITGDRAILEYKDDKGEWKEMDFVKEGGEWKLTLPRAERP
jgi:hypothetical protein